MLMASPASLNASTGALQFGGDTAFTASATSDVELIPSVGAGTVSNIPNTVWPPVARSTTIAGGAEVVTVKVGTATASVSLANGTTKAQALQQLNDSFNALGVFAVNDAAGTNIEFQSKSALQLHGPARLQRKGIFGADVSSMTAATDPSASGNATSAATAAITAITTAVSSLSVVQGKVGTAQNKISYAIQLAQSQITNFSGCRIAHSRCGYRSGSCQPDQGSGTVTGFDGRHGSGQTRRRRPCCPCSAVNLNQPGSLAS